jgi:hypothetical protein
MKSRFVLVALFLAVLSPLLAQAQSPYVICSGGPALRRWEEYRVPGDRHDKYWGNFITSARIRMQQLRGEYGPQLPIEWLIFRPGYVTRQAEDSRSHTVQYVCDVNLIHQAAAKVNARIVWFDSTREFCSFLNAHRGGNRMSGFEYYGHSNKFCFLFEYSNEVLGCSSVYLHQKHLGRMLSRGIFTKDAHVQSYGCHTGESMSAAWDDATGHPMIGAIGKTDFSAIKDNKSLPALSGGRWAQ